MEYIGVFILLCFIIFPLPYIYYKRGQNKFLYISSVIGSSAVIEILALLVVLPAIILLTFVFPQLEAVGLSKNIAFLFPLSDYVQEYYFFITPVLHVLMSYLILRRYELFQTNT